MTSYIYSGVIVPDGRFNIPVSIIMMMYQITSNVIGILLVLMILYLVSGLVYFRYKDTRTFVSLCELFGGGTLSKLAETSPHHFNF